METKLKLTLLPGGILACLLLSLVYNTTYACVMMQTVPTAAPSATTSPVLPEASPTLPSQTKSTPIFIRSSPTFPANTPTPQESGETQVQLPVSSPSPISPTDEISNTIVTPTPISANITPTPPPTAGMLYATEWLKSLYLLICGFGVIGGGVVIAIIITRQRKTQSNQK